LKVPKLGLEVILIIDFVVHVLPVVVLGIPRFIDYGRPVVAAGCVVGAWYIIARDHIPELYYLPESHKHYRDAIIAVGFVTLVCMAALFGKK
jgi:hypothetical protein